MRRILTFVFSLLITAGAVSAQTAEQQVGKIRQVYSETNKRIAAGSQDNSQGFHYAVWRVGGKGDAMQWAAVGVMEEIDEIWFDGGDTGAGEDEDDTKAKIYKIVSTYKSAGALHWRNEYYFDQTGKLVFILASGDEDSESGKLVERRFYYANDKLIRVASGSKNTDKNFSAADAEKSNDESESARQMQKRYARMLDGD